jgi:hypothetical protein
MRQFVFQLLANDQILHCKPRSQFFGWKLNRKLGLDLMTRYQMLEKIFVDHQSAGPKRRHNWVFFEMQNLISDKKMIICENLEQFHSFQYICSIQYKIHRLSRRDKTSM